MVYAFGMDSLIDSEGLPQCWSWSTSNASKSVEKKKNWIPEYKSFVYFFLYSRICLYNVCTVVE